MDIHIDLEDKRVCCKRYSDSRSCPMYIDMPNGNRCALGYWNYSWSVTLGQNSLIDGHPWIEEVYNAYITDRNVLVFETLGGDATPVIVRPSRCLEENGE